MSMIGLGYSNISLIFETADFSYLQYTVGIYMISLEPMKNRLNADAKNQS